MTKQRRAGTSPEMKLRRELHGRGLRFFVQRRPLPTLRSAADVIFPRSKVAVFVHGCFWHGCPEHGTMPKSNSDWWRAKLTANADRDARTVQALEMAGWAVVVVWEHESASWAADRVQEVVSTRREVDP
jgi:DNA mismatch endonuclease (patch repair protein)